MSTLGVEVCEVKAAWAFSIQIEHGQEQLAVFGQQVGESLGIEVLAAVGVGKDMVTSRYRWWPICRGLKTPDDTASPNAGAAIDFSTFHYAGDIIVSRLVRPIPPTVAGLRALRDDVGGAALRGIQHSDAS